MINEQMKAEYEANPVKWDVYAKDELSVNYRKLESCNFSSTKATYKIILKEHSPIAQAVIENPDIEVEYKHFRDTVVSKCENFFESYSEHKEYKLTRQSKPDVDTLQINSMEDLNDLPIVGEDTISIKDRWEHIEGGLYVVSDVALSLHKEAIIFYRPLNKEREFCRTKSDFLENFTKPKPKWYEDEELLAKGVDVVYENGDRYVVYEYNAEEGSLHDLSGSIIDYVDSLRLLTKLERDSLLCVEDVEE